MTASQGASHVEVNDDDEGQRIDNFLLGRLKGVPRSHVYRLIRSGQVRVNSGRIRPAYRLLVERADGFHDVYPPA